MKTFKFHLLAALLFCFSLASKGQSQADSAVYNREFGFGTNIILSEIFRTETSPFDFSYRWRSRTGYTRIGGSVGLNGFGEEVFGYNRESINFSSEGFFGKEWRVDLAKRWMLNYGGDLLAGFGNSEVTNIMSDYNVITEIHKRSDQTYSLGIRPFIGVIFKISNRLYLNTEASLRTEVGRIFLNREKYQINNGLQGENLDIGKTDLWRYNLASLAAGNIFVYYRF